MALIRGFNSDCPCPICLVKANELANQRVNYPSRTAGDTQDLLVLASQKHLATERDKVLKEQSIRNIQV